MLDVHDHLLPGVDDGSGSVTESLRMARCAAADGISRVICTPHMEAGPNASAMLASHVKLREELRRALEAEGIALALLPGAEWMLSPDLLEQVQEQGCLADSRAFLFELSPYMPFDAAEGLLPDAARAGLIPILAHPERHPWLEGDGRRLSALAAGGCYLQITASSLYGCFGKTARRGAEDIARRYPERLILASDAHDPEFRPPCLSQGYAALDKLKAGLARQARNTLSLLLRTG